MKYTEPERLDIGRQLYDREISINEAVEKYNITQRTATRYKELYISVNKLEGRYKTRFGVEQTPTLASKVSEAEVKGMADYEHMTREELIRELALSKINELRAKKGYIVKGAGSEKEYIRFDSKNTK